MQRTQYTEKGNNSAVISVKFCDVFLNQSHTVIEQLIFQENIEILQEQQTNVHQSRITSNLKTFFLVSLKVKYL